MPEPPLPPLTDELAFHGPLSDERAELLIRSLGPLAGQHLVDLGCGWAELLLRALATAGTATGHGIDEYPPDIEHAIATATTRGLAGRVSFDVGDAGSYHGAADVLLIVGASQVFGGDPRTHTANALAAGRHLLRPGGRLLLGEGFWARPPSADQLAAMSIPAEQYGTLGELVDTAVAHGYRPLSVSVASQDEWDEFESAHGRRRERWLLANPGSPDHAAVRAAADAHRTAWLHGWRGVLGLAYLTLAVPG